MVKNRVVIAMSGGVDSSVAAALLKAQGYEVIGITMCFGSAVGESSGRRPACCGPQAIRDACRVAKELKIRHYVLNFSKDLEKYVIENFICEYLSGRTPNPCVRCNKFIKFGSLVRKARSLDAKFLATGHYAQVEFDKKLKQYQLKKGKDKTKDQSYFLYSIDKKVLPYVLFPLGNLTKVEVRAQAKKFNLPVSEKPASQEICFIPDADYRGFINNRLPRIIRPGPIKDLKGNIIGKHKGIPFYTIGQRQGLGVSSREPLYVVDINAKDNSIILGNKTDTYSNGLIADKLNLLYPISNRRVDLNIKIRYNQPEAKSSVSILAKNKSKEIQVQVKFKKPLSSVAPGQAVVFYKGDIVVGGATIIEAIK
ncbi:MAG: tRNA 2-thiouridine(34) synthase MnmA [Candidatus Omnitrophota bacterium]